MTGINRVFVPDYVIVEFAEEATRKAHRLKPCKSLLAAEEYERLPWAGGASIFESVQ